jgi:hypothetical protein
MVWWTAGTSQMKPTVTTVQITISTVELAKFALQWIDAVMERMIVLMAVMRKVAVSTH